MTIAVEVDQPAQLDADIGHHAGDMGGAHLGVGKLGDDRVLQAHDEAQQDHGQRHEKPGNQHQPRAEDAEQQQQCGFQRQR